MTLRNGSVWNIVRCTRQVVESDTLSSLVLSNLDEFAVLIKFLRAQNTSDTPRAVADELAALMRAYQLQSAIQVRMGNDELTISHHGDNWPLDVSVIKHVRKMGRIFEFKRQAAYNFEHVTVLVSNVPIDDPDLCGRIRDNLAIAGESANAKLASLSTREENRQARQGRREPDRRVEGSRYAHESRSNRHATVVAADGGIVDRLDGSSRASARHDAPAGKRNP